MLPPRPALVLAMLSCVWGVALVPLVPNSRELARSAQPRMTSVQVIDLFPDPPTVGGRSYARPSSVFPRDLAAPEATQKVQRAVVTPRPEFTDVVFQPLGGTDGAAIVFLSLALFLGPDFMLAPLGIASEARLGFLAEGKLGRFLGIGGDWLEDREARLSSDAPLAVTVATLSLFLLIGLVSERLLIFSLEDSSFVLSLGICGCLGGGLYELIRPKLLTREEFRAREFLQSEFTDFAAARLMPTRTGACHETEVIKAFRLFYGKYRRAPQADEEGGISDSEILSLMRNWARFIAAERSPAGYWKGVMIASAEDVGLS